jgi:FkbM family methyltransferase
MSFELKYANPRTQSGRQSPAKQPKPRFLTNDCRAGIRPMKVAHKSSALYEIRQGVKAMLHRRGLMVGQYPLWHCLRRVQPTVILDVGANVGVYGAHVRDLGFQGTIHSFEPFPPAYRSLQTAAKASRPVNAWRCHAFGLGQRDSEVTMHVFRESVFNSLHERLPQSAEIHSGIRSGGTVAVAIRTLDGVWDELGLSPERVFLKIDTQGHELPILRGGERALKNIAAVQLEVSLSPLYHDQPCIETVIPFMRKRGFSVFDAFPAGGIRGRSHQLMEIDFLFVQEAGA